MYQSYVPPRKPSFLPQVNPNLSYEITYPEGECPIFVEKRLQKTFDQLILKRGAKIYESQISYENNSRNKNENISK
jgi:hypothetical protein